MLASAARKTEAPAVAPGTVVLADGVHIPPGITSLDTFRRWARSDAFPRRGRFTWLAGELRVDLSMEQLFAHNLVKTEFVAVPGSLVRDHDFGYLCSDGMRFSHPGAELSVEPDTFFVSFDAIQGGRVRQIPPKEGDGVIELEGAPDMVLEIVSLSPVKQDTHDLRSAYWTAGVTEYWLVDARPEQPKFDLFKRGKKGYVPTRPGPKGLRSGVLTHHFRLTRGSDPLGQPRFRLTATA